MTRQEAQEQHIQRMQAGKDVLLELARALPRHFLEEYGFNRQVITAGLIDNADLPIIDDMVRTAVERGLLRVY